MEIKPNKMDWWRLNPLEYSVYDIEWSPQCGGVVRARFKDNEFEYITCGDVRYALDIGYRIINMQMEVYDVS